MKKFYNRRHLLIQQPDFFKKNKKRRDLHKFATKLAEDAIMEGIFSGCPPKYNVEQAIQKGEPIPERFKPGRKIMSLSKEEREMVKDLKQKHFNNRFMELGG